MIYTQERLQNSSYRNEIDPAEFTIQSEEYTTVNCRGSRINHYIKIFMVL